ncbi:hypothetical protein KC19_12G081800 [Ceratodon purpureus]|uniref:Uncharacterized protein n=1 Tax=Ceratodon purpureus TaxID=3225 RepID=A0A8T0G4V2_CERPU|nr:hypothetical protein KC19_12G081800 [Ceratodon purpureus]
MSSRHGGGRAVRSGSRGGSSGSAPPEGIKELIRDSVYLLSEPGHGAPNMEVVFIHGLTVEDYHDAYWRTWTVGNNDTECWPIKFLKADFPNARILAVCYDSSLFVAGAAGMSDLYAAGETLVSALVEKPVSVGLNNCPIVFVCHCLGGLLAKQIIVHVDDRKQHRNDPKYKNFLDNIRGFQFYSTPHQGSHLGSRLAGLARSRLSSRKKARSKMAKALNVINDDVGRLNGKFDAVKDSTEYRDKWFWSNVVEKNETHLECGFHGLVVTETSARLGPTPITYVDTDYLGVCKPESTTSRSYISLKNLIQKIVEGISQDAFKSRRGIFGIDDKLQKISEMLAEHSVIGLWGMGGIGKTTLVRCWYDQEREKRNYMKFCFLANVRDCNIEDCQKDLYSCLFGSGWEGKSKDDRLMEIKKYIKSNKVLLVADDVDDAKQLEALQVEELNEVGISGSKMIVTSRERDVLGIISAEGILELQYLNDEHALEIFSYKAFRGVGENMQLAKFKDQAKVIVKACGGLPLSLEVIGSYLRGTYLRGSFDIRIWEEVVVKLQRAVSLSGSAEDKLWATLMISYKKLDDEHKSMFLDFASVICEMGLVTRRTLEAIWDTPSGVRNLIDRSLIKWNDDNDSLTMHDQLRDLGRHVVRGNPDEPKNRSRIWERGVKGLEIMMLNEGHQHLKGVSLHEVTNGDLKRIKKSLQSEGLLIGPSHLNFEKLRLLNLHAIGAEVLDYCVNLCSEERLMCLHLSGSQISHNVCKNIFKKLGSFRNLRVLQIRGFSSRDKLTLPNEIGELTQLRMLLLAFTDLDKLPESVCKLSLLEELDLSSTPITSLPDEIGELNGLRKLLLQGSDLCELPDSVCKLSLLEELDLWRTWIKSLPDEIGELNGLRKLLLQGSHLCALPDSVCKLSLLEELDLRRTWIKSLPDEIGELNGLRKLLLGRTQLCELPESVCKLSLLEELDLTGCINLQRLPKKIGDLQQLRRLHLSSCLSLEIPDDTQDELSRLRLFDVRPLKLLMVLYRFVSKMRRAS